MRTYAAILVLAVSALIAQKSGVAPDQPIAYSHKKHLAMGLQCKNCHTNPDPGETMGIPATSVCMGCHKTVAADSGEIRKLAKHHEDKTDVPWVRVYQIPGYVFFSHRAHGEAGAACHDCHGQVAQADKLRRETDISMGGCMNCHRARKASNDCAFCHEPK